MEIGRCCKAGCFPLKSRFTRRPQDYLPPKLQKSQLPSRHLYIFLLLWLHKYFPNPTSSLPPTSISGSYLTFSNCSSFLLVSRASSLSSSNSSLLLPKWSFAADTLCRDLHTHQGPMLTHRIPCPEEDAAGLGRFLSMLLARLQLINPHPILSTLDTELPGHYTVYSARPPVPIGLTLTPHSDSASFPPGKLPPVRQAPLLYLVLPKLPCMPLLGISYRF